MSKEDWIETVRLVKNEVWHRTSRQALEAGGYNVNHEVVLRLNLPLLNQIVLQGREVIEDQVWSDIKL